MPSFSTTARLAPDAPTPRRLTPCDVGFDVRLLVRRKSVKPGTCLSKSSSVSAAVVERASGEKTVRVDGVSLRRAAARSAEWGKVCGTRAGDQANAGLVGPAPC